MRYVWIIFLFLLSARTGEAPATPLTPSDERFFLKAYAEHAVDQAHPKISQARRVVVVSLLVDVAMSTFPDHTERQFWIAQIGAESAYDGRQRSTKGAIGLGQLLAAYKNDFGADCGLTDVDDADLHDDYTNAVLSACYFKHLIKETGDVGLALVAYNAGPNSPDLAKAKRGQQPSKEPRLYRKRITQTVETYK